eukprot:TRINITY_DN79796_c0_g1_i1.p1 TRINITY_DN79796_c0_g1~~TRINITY_DN79796_c0_g1_i1.p1  ORF type:complete len:378 (+),score=47.69 TRINITY_DN79796_c0_g1_i1:31-1164(+)
MPGSGASGLQSLSARGPKRPEVWQRSQTPSLSSYGAQSSDPVKRHYYRALTPSSASRSQTPSLHPAPPKSFTPGLTTHRCESQGQQRPASSLAAPLAARRQLHDDDDELDPEEALLLATQGKKTGVRLYPFNPHCKSIVDQLVFRHDIDNSGDDFFKNPDFLNMFQNSAGRPSWNVPISSSKQMHPKPEGAAWGPSGSKSAPRGRRQFAGSPLASSVVDSVVFGHDIDASGNDDERFDGIAEMNLGAAGCPSWVDRPQGIGCAERAHRLRQKKLQQCAKQFSARLAKSTLASEAKQGAPRHRQLLNTAWESSARATPRTARKERSNASEVMSQASCRTAATPVSRSRTPASSVPAALSEALSSLRPAITFKHRAGPP